MTVAKSSVAAIFALIVSAGCSHAVEGDAEPLAAADSDAPRVAPADLQSLLLSDSEMSEAVGLPGLVSHDRYQDIPPSEGETYSDPLCMGAVYNTMYTAYVGVDFTGVAGTKVSDSDYKWGATDTDQGVVSFRDADAASRFVTRTLIDWDRCADRRVSGKNGPEYDTVTWTIGFPTVTDDIPTLLISPEGGERLACERAITSRSNVVIDVYVCATNAQPEQAAAVVKAIADKMPH